MTPPYLAKGKAGNVQLVVNGEPFLCLAGELQNSSSSSASYMASLCANLRNMHLNTLFFPVAWEQIEPVEDVFAFDELDSSLAVAREYGFKLALVWFGSYKNGMSTYVPGWVKKDPQRFPRARIGDDKRAVEVLSPFVEANWRADAKAYAKLLKHINAVDAEQQTFVLAQVENEPGLLGDSRDRSVQAEQAWRAGVPDDLITGLAALPSLHAVLQSRLPNLHSSLEAAATKDWVSVFGREADEVFMANAMSRYVEHVAKAGKAVYALPTLINTWLSCDDAATLDLYGFPLKHNMTTAAGGGNRPGDYPSGGCCPQVLDIWRFNAPSLDIFSPDVYLHKFDWVCQQYASVQDVLLIPEMRRDEYGARRILYAYGQHNCLAASPFGIDTMRAEEAPFERVFDVLNKSRKVLLNTNMGVDSFGFLFDEMERPESSLGEERTKVWGDWKLTVKRAHVFGEAGPGAGIIVRQPNDTFFCIGWGYAVFFSSLSKPFTGILSAKELEYDDTTDSLVTARWLNGDETCSGACLIMPNAKPDEGGFPIPITIPARTALSEVVPYAL